ncbi:hypothetical protein TKK_0002277 [Trichogramma kaykai]|uniref:DUF4817 domain-containing protein n=1 Tax=Trichogramma kaykai TaxID=54128 RepID=A0ABD2XCU6_9HYME
MANRRNNTPIFSSGEYADMVLCYGAANKIETVAATLYREKFGPREDQPNRAERRMPDRRTIIGAVRRLRETGSVTVKSPNGGRPHRERLIHQEAVLQAFEDDPQTSLSIVANQSNTSYSNCQRIMKDAGQHDFKFRKGPGLHGLHQVNQAWSYVSSETIKNCYRKAGFVKDAKDIPSNVSNVDSIEIYPQDMPNEEFDEWVNIDENLQTSVKPMDDDIRQEAIQTESEDEDDDDDDDNFEPAPTSTEMFNAL